MASRIVQFNHLAPNIPTLTKGARLTASGVAPPSPSFLGDLLALGSGNNQFGDGVGQGQKAYDAVGRLYVCDTESNKKVKRFAWNSMNRKFEWDSEVTTLSALGASVKPTCVVIHNGTLYLSAYDQSASGTWVRYWNNVESLWPNLTVANSSGAFGSNTSGADSSGVLGTGYTLSIGLVGGVLSALATGFGSNKRVILWRVSDGAVLAQAAPAGFARYRHIIGSDGKLYGGNNLFSGALPGLHEINSADLTSSLLALFASYSFGTSYWQRKQRASANGGSGFLADLIEHDGVLYLRETNPSQLHAWRISDRSYLGLMLRAGFDESTSVSNCFAGPSNFFTTNGSSRLGSHMGLSSMPDHLLFWASNAPGEGIQGYLKAIPTSVSTATWSYSGPWHTSGSQLARIFVPALQKSQGRVRVRKNGGSWVTASLAQAASGTFFASISCSGADVLEIQLLMSTFYDLEVYDPNDVSLSTKRSAETILIPSDIQVFAEFSESGEIYIADPTIYIGGELAIDGAVEGWIA